MFNGMKTRRVLVNGNMNYDIETGKQRKVFLELEYTGLRKDERPPVAGVVLQNKHARALHVDNPDNYTITASSEPHRKGYAFTGRILGEYQVMLLMPNTPMPILIDQMLLLDNLEKDDDAGEVVVPLMGKIRVRLNNADDSGELPKFVNITIRRTDSMATSWTENTLPLDSSSSDPVIEYYPVGDYSATLNAGDFRVTPSHVPFSVNLSGESIIDFTLSKPALSASTSQ
jgi:hypothetical protein